MKALPVVVQVSWWQGCSVARVQVPRASPPASNRCNGSDIQLGQWNISLATGPRISLTLKHKSKQQLISATIDPKSPSLDLQLHLMAASQSLVRVKIHS